MKDLWNLSLAHGTGILFDWETTKHSLQAWHRKNTKFELCLQLTAAVYWIRLLYSQQWHSRRTNSSQDFDQILQYTAPFSSVVTDSESATESADSARVRPSPNPRIFCSRKWRFWVICYRVNIYLSGGGVARLNRCAAVRVRACTAGALSDAGHVGGSQGTQTVGALVYWTGGNNVGHLRTQIHRLFRMHGLTIFFQFCLAESFILDNCWKTLASCGRCHKILQGCYLPLK